MTFYHLRNIFFLLSGTSLITLFSLLIWVNHKETLKRLDDIITNNDALDITPEDNIQNETENIRTTKSSL
jgi:hypothetical protein